MSDICRWSERVKGRVVKDRHAPWHLESCEDEACRGCATHPDNCPGCQVCPPEIHCIVDHWRHLEDGEKRTCTHCLNQARRNLRLIVELVALLPEELVDRGGASFGPIPKGATDTKIPGGDALVLLAPGNGAGHHDPNIELSSDPQPPLAMLATWEDDVRLLRGLHSAGPATYTAVTGFLSHHLSWAAQNHPAFDEMAKDFRDTRARLEGFLRAGTRPMRADARCLECGGTLEKRYRDPEPCSHQRDTDPGIDVAQLRSMPPLNARHDLLRRLDRHQGWGDGQLVDRPKPAPCGYCDQGGLADDRWTCNRCGLKYDDDQYNNALRAALENAS